MLRPRPLAGSDRQRLAGLRVGLALYILLAFGSMVVNVFTVGRFDSGVALQLIVRNILGLLPPAAVLVAVSIRNPPAGAALDAVAGLGIASILFRFGYLAFAGVFVSALNQADVLSAMLPRLVGFSAVEAGLSGLALYLRSRVGPLNPATLFIAVLAFLLWDGAVQAVMQVLVSLIL